MVACEVACCWLGSRTAVNKSLPKADKNWLYTRTLLSLELASQSYFLMSVVGNERKKEKALKMKPFSILSFVFPENTCSLK